MTRSLFLTRLALLASLPFFFAAGCGGSGATKQKVFFNQSNNAEPYRASQNAALKKLFAGHDNIELIVTDGQGEANKQISQIETAILQKPALLIVAPQEREPLNKVMGEAMAAGIPVICLERDIVEENYTTFIQCDNRAIGALAGQWIVDHLTKKNGAPKGTVVELRGNPGTAPAVQRHEGAREVIAKHPGIKIVHDAVADWYQDEAMNRMSEALTANAAGSIDVVYGHNDPMAYGAYLAAKEAGREKEMVFVGVDGLADEGAQYVKDGVLAVTFEYPLCVDKAYEIGLKIIENETYKPEKTYVMKSRMIDE